MSNATNNEGPFCLYYRCLQGNIYRELCLSCIWQVRVTPPICQYLKPRSCWQVFVWDVVLAFPVCITGVTERCSLFGRDHIHTFDGVLYQFPGDCSYLLAGDCNHRSFSLLGEMQSPHPLSLTLYFANLFYSAWFALLLLARTCKLFVNEQKNHFFVLCSIHRWLCEWQKSWSYSVSGRCVWTSPVCGRAALSRRNEVWKERMIWRIMSWRSKV